MNNHPADRLTPEQLKEGWIEAGEDIKKGEKVYVGSYPRGFANVKYPFQWASVGYADRDIKENELFLPVGDLVD